MQFVWNWLQRNFSNPQAVILAFSLVAGVAFVYFFGGILAPVLASVIIAYLLEDLVGLLVRRKVPRLVAVIVVFLAFVCVFVFALIALLPLLLEQIGRFLQSLPDMIAQVQLTLLRLPELYPHLVTEEQVRELIGVSRDELRSLGQTVFSVSMSSILGVASVLVYLILIPFLVFFLLKDKERILNWLTGLLPRNRQLVVRVWQEVDLQIGNYLRGKFWEVLIIWGASSLTFALLGLDFAVVIGLMVGLSVLVPYIGVAVMTIPVGLAAWFQFGWSGDLLYVMIAYAVIQLLDGNLLAPLLLSEVVNLHPVAIITAVLFFGGLWGFWGVVFAVPLATLVRAVHQAWPRVEYVPEEPSRV